MDKYTEFLQWLQKIKNIYAAELINNNERFVKLMEKFE